MQTLNSLNENEQATIIRIELGMLINFRRRLYEMGFCSGVKLKVLKISILKNSFLICFNGITITMQKEFAEQVVVDKNE